MSTFFFGWEKNVENFPSNSPATSHRRHYHAQVDGTDYKTHIYTFTTSVWIPKKLWDSHLIEGFCLQIFKIFITGNQVKSAPSDQFSCFRIFSHYFCRFFSKKFLFNSAFFTVNPRHCPPHTLLQLHFTRENKNSLFSHPQKTCSEPFAAHRKKSFSQPSRSKHRNLIINMEHVLESTRNK